MKQTLLLIILALMSHAQIAIAAPDSPPPKTEPPHDSQLALLPGEQWWGGRVTDAKSMPFDAHSDLVRGLGAAENSEGNQTQPFLISNKGRFIWSDQPFTLQFSRGTLSWRNAAAPLVSGQAGDSLSSAYAEASRRFFPPSGRMPAKELFIRPQYNTWIELRYDQSQERILKYARDIVAQGFPPGVLMIDDNWQEDYGTWDFSSKRFSDPKKMIAELHAMGFRVMLWICPFVSADSETYRFLAHEGFLLREASAASETHSGVENSDVVMVRWWNGVSALLDLSHPGAKRWYRERLDHLVTDYGVDGFKFDAGDSPFYLPRPGAKPIISHAARTPEEHTMDFASIGLDFPFNEYRAAWKCAGAPLAQRLRDKDHSWEALGELVPGTLAQGLMGYAFTCPDMIGGGLASAFDDPSVFDPELVVRSAQVHALMPMMQFSVAPWRVLSPELAGYCRDAARLHASFAAYIEQCVEHSRKTGEPIVRPLEWRYPHCGYERIGDEFMLGDEWLVAPVLTKGARSRTVVFPAGRWIAADGTAIEGPVTREIDAPLGQLPFFHLAK